MNLEDQKNANFNLIRRSIVEWKRQGQSEGPTMRDPYKVHLDDREIEVLEAMFERAHKAIASLTLPGVTAAIKEVNEAVKVVGVAHARAWSDRQILDSHRCHPLPSRLEEFRRVY